MPKCRMHQNSGCTFGMAFRLLAGIKGIGVLVQGPLSCGAGLGNLIAFNNRSSGSGKETAIAYTHYDEGDLIMGGASKLKQALLQFTQRYDCSVICVLKTCLPAMNADHYEPMVRDVEGMTGRRIYLIDSQGIQSPYCNDVYQVLAEQFFGACIERTGPDESMLNVINTSDDGIKDCKELYRMLLPLGVKPNFMPFYSDMDQLRLAGNAVASAYLCEVPGDPLAAMLHRRFGVAPIYQKPPIGIEYTDRWLRSIGEVFGKEKETLGFIAGKHRHIRPVLEDIKASLRGKRVFLSAGKGKLQSWVTLCQNLGLTIEGLGSIYTPYPDKNRLSCEAKQPVIEDVQWHEVREYLRDTKPDFYLGEQGYISEILAMDIPVIQSTRFDPASPSLYGYDSLVGVGKLMVERLARKPGFTAKIKKYMNTID